MLMLTFQQIYLPDDKMLKNGIFLSKTLKTIYSDSANEADQMLI